MKTIDFKKLFFTISSVFAVITILAMFIMSGLSAKEVGFNRDYTDFSQEWYYCDSGENAQIESISKNMKIHKTIPSLDKDAILSFNARNIDVKVYVDDICVFETQPTKNGVLKALYGKTPGSIFAEIPIKDEYSGKELYIDIDVPYKNTRNCKIVHMNFGSGVDIMQHIVSTQLGSFCFSIIVLFIGIVCLILYLPLLKANIVDESMLYLGTMSLAFGMTMITDSKMLQSIIRHESLFYVTSQMFMGLIAVPLLMFFDKISNVKKSKVTYVLCLLSLLNFAVSFIINLLGVSDYNETGFVNIMITAASIGYILVLTVKDFIKKTNQNTFHNVGIILMAVSVVLDMIVPKIATFIETSFFTKFGFAGFVCMEFVQILWNHIQNYQKGVKAQLVSRLAYYDGLTDMLNRTSFTEDMEKLEKENHSDILIAVFDINNLKYVNDTFGHTSGDELIVSVANIIRSCFEDLGSCYRTGGDEFVFIAKRKLIEKNFVEAKDKMLENMSKASEYTEYPMSVAVGYSVMSKNHSTLRQVFDEADERMYLNKKEIKEKEKAKITEKEKAKAPEKTDDKAKDKNNSAKK